MDYVKKIKNVIKENLDRYSFDNNNDNNNTCNNNNNNDNNNNRGNIYDNNNFSSNNKEREKEKRFTINDQLLLETILVMIRGETIKYSSYKKKQITEQEVTLEREIKQLEEQVQNNLKDISMDEILLLNDKKEKLEEIRKIKMDGVMLRSRCRYEDLGEKPTKYFLNLQNRNYQDKVINHLIDENGEEIYKTKDILEAQKSYYKNLYDETIEVDDTPISEIIGKNEKQLNDDEAELLEGEITYEELKIALKNMKNSKSPGNDGFTAEFFKFFWVDLGEYILKSINYAYRHGLLSVTQTQGIITCLPKPNKARNILKNWRPISLLNVIYKMMSAAIANRLKTVLSKLVNQDQKGFITGRYIGENIRLVYDVLFETKQQQIPGLLLSIDFQQAFDSISWKFIHKVLDYFNFGPSIKRWIKLFQTGVESSILQNGFMSDFFQLKRGCRQGDPISPYIFILYVEVLGMMIRKSSDVKGIKINGTEFKLSQYADGTQMFLDGSESSLRSALIILKQFYLMSGLNINLDKTKALWIGSMCKSSNIICREFNIDWEQEPLKILGVIFSPEVFDIWDHNLESVMKKVQSMIKIWSKRKLTLIGRITVIKSLMLSRFAYLFLALPNPPGDLIKSLERMLFKFLWNKGPDRISRKQIVKNVESGGLRMVEFNAFISSLKVTWLRRLILNSENNNWSLLSGLNFNELVCLGDQYFKGKIRNLHNPFWRDLLNSLHTFYSVIKIEELDDILCTPLWCNSKLSKNENFLFKNWFEMGVRNVIDIVDTNGYIYEFEQLKQIYNLKGTYLDYQRLINKLPKTWRDVINENNEKCKFSKFNVQINCYLKLIMKDKKGSRSIYDKILPVKEQVQINRWNTDLGQITIEEQKLGNANLKYINEIKLRDFQFKINNKILVTNSFLYKINKIDNHLCSFCQKETESIYHLLCTCDIVKAFWDTFKTWVSGKINTDINLSDKNIIYSAFSKCSLLNYLIVLAKYYIYKNKFHKKSLKKFESYVKVKFNNEMYIAK